MTQGIIIKALERVLIISNRMESSIKLVRYGVFRNEANRRLLGMGE